MNADLISFQARQGQQSPPHSRQAALCSETTEFSVEGARIDAHALKKMVDPVLPNYLRLPGSRKPQKGQLQGRSSPSFQELKEEESSGDCVIAWSRASHLEALAERCSQGSTLGRGTSLEKALTAEH